MIRMHHWASACSMLALLAVPLAAAAQSPPAAPPADPPAPRDKPQSPGPAPHAAQPQESLSDRLQRNDGVIRPPAGIAPDNTIVPEEPGRIRIIPPPGSPQGDPTVKPK